MNRVLKDRLSTFNSSKNELRRVAETEQVRCAHKHVYEVAWESLSAIGGCLSARRICEGCRYEEEGSHWSGGAIWRVENGETKLGNAKGRSVQIVSREKFYAYRLPL